MTRLEFKLKNSKKLEQKLALIGRNSGPKALRLIKDATLELHELAVKGVQEISQGETVTRGNRGKGRFKKNRGSHVVSKPGDPPNTDTGRSGTIQ